MLPILQKEIVEKKQWCSQEEIMDFFALAQSIPGIIMTNTSVLIGYKVKGGLGALFAIVGTALPSIITILIIALFMRDFMEIDTVQLAFSGVRIAVAALLCNAAYTMAKVGITNPITALVFVVSLIGLFIFPHVSPIIFIISAGIVGVIYHYIRSKSQ